MAQRPVKPGLAADPVPMSLVCFGPPAVRLETGAAPADLQWRKHLALLAYLALSPNRCRSRDHLLGLLWPEKNESQARHSLSEALRRLRAALGAGRLPAEGESIVLDDTDLTLDAWAFERAAPLNPAAALSLYRGDFLDGLSLDDAPAFDEWLLRTRARYRALAAGAALACGEQALGRLAFAAAEDMAAKAQSLDPLSERATQLLMRSRGLAGDVGGALDAFHQYQRLLAAELREEPGRELQALAGRLRAGRWRRAEQPSEFAIPFAGGGQAVSDAMREAAAARAGGPRLLLISGAAGHGKSRLLAEVLQRSGIEGAETVIARPVGDDADRAWSTMRQIFRQLAVMPGVLAADGDTLAVAAGFAPSLTERVAPRPVEDVARVSAALAALLAAVADEQPVALGVDDAHLADGPSLNAIRGALESLRGAKVLVALAAPDDLAEAPAALLALARSAGASLPGGTARLGPLDGAGAEALVRTLVPDESQESVARLARRLVHETGGSPYWIVMLLRGLRASAALRDDLLSWPPRSRTLDATLPDGVPALARLAAVSRLAELAEDQRAVLVAAAMADPAWDAAVLAHVTGRTRDEVEQTLVALERLHLMRYADERFSFAAPLFASVVREACLPPGERERLRSRVVAALEARNDGLDTDVRLAELRAERAGPEAFAWAVACAERALAARSLRGTSRAIRAAQRAAEGDHARDARLEPLRRALDQLRA